MPEYTFTVIRIFIAIAMLTICTVQDIRTGYIDTLIVLIATGIFIAIEIITNKTILMADIILGVVFLILSKVCKGVGEGDLYVLFALCLISGCNTILGIMFMSFMTAGIYALYLRCVKKVSLSEGFPFVPFITCGYVFNLLITLG